MRQLVSALAELRLIEDALTLFQRAAPDPERAAFLVAVGRTISDLEAIPIPPPPPTWKPWAGSPSDPPTNGP
jgi:hypothetical protein